MAHQPTITKGAKVRELNFSRKIAPCPRCGEICKRHSVGKRRIREIGIKGPSVLEVTYSKHYCVNCRKYFSLPMEHLAPPNSRFTNRVHRIALDLMGNQSLSYKEATNRMEQKYHVHIPPTTLCDWVAAEMML
jgi:hypothetical protein